VDLCASGNGYIYFREKHLTPFNPPLTTFNLPYFDHLRFQLFHYDIILMCDNYIAVTNSMLCLVSVASVNDNLECHCRQGYNDEV